MSKPAYETLDVEDIPGGADERYLQRQVRYICGGEITTTLDSLTAELTKNGPDIPNPGQKGTHHRSALMGAALHLPEEQYYIFRDRFAQSRPSYAKVRRAS